MGGILRLLDDRMSTATNGANQPRVSEVGVSPRAKVLLFAAVAIIVIITVARTCIWWRADAGISFASGVMITMASDVTHGVFYRPLFGPLGYGGTRYSPLYLLSARSAAQAGVAGSVQCLSAFRLGHSVADVRNLLAAARTRSGDMAGMVRER